MTLSDSSLSALAASHDIISIGAAADDRRRALHGARTTYVRVADVSATPGEAVEVPEAAGEVRIVGIPASSAAAVTRVREVCAAARGIPVSGYSLADLEALATAEQQPLRALLESLRAAGLELVAEAPLDRLRDARAAIEEVNIAGLALARLVLDTLPETDVLALYRSVADLQDAVGVIRAFAPLPRRVSTTAPTTGYDDVRRVALARLAIPNIPSIQVDWALYGPKLAQVALTMGADDLDGVSASDAAPEGRRRAPLEEVRRNITAAALEPVERNGRSELQSA